MEEKPLGQTLSDDEKSMLGTLANEIQGFLPEIEEVKEKADAVKAILDEKTASAREQIENIMADVPSFQDVHDAWRKAYVAFTEDENVEAGVAKLKEYIEKLKNI